MRRIPRRSRRSRGFTLIESLVAVAVATTTLAGFYSAISTGLNLDKRADERARQIAVATSIMDRVGTQFPIAPGLTENGSLDTFDWQLTISNRGTEEMVLGEVDSDMLAFIYVEVAGREEGTSPVALRSLRYLESPL